MRAFPNHSLPGAEREGGVWRGHPSSHPVPFPAPTPFSLRNSFLPPSSLPSFLPMTQCGKTLAVWIALKWEGDTEGGREGGREAACNRTCRGHLEGHQIPSGRGQRASIRLANPLPPSLPRSPLPVALPRPPASPACLRRCSANS